jgi:repressor LexA
MSVDLTKRQREIFDYIRRYLRKYGYPPTVREIGNALGLHSPSTVHAHLAKLEQIGMLRRDPTKPRAIELMVGKARRALKGPGVPVVGNVAAGEPILADENIEDYYEVPSVIGGEGDDYILKVRGDSMKDAGILEGDFVVVRPTDEAANGEIVVALLGDEATVKRFYRERNAIRLEPENDAHEPITTQDAELLGKVIGVFRQV